MIQRARRHGPTIFCTADLRADITGEVTGLGHIRVESLQMKFARFGNQIPFTEPYWYQGYPSAYYHEGHVAFRKIVRDFVEEELKPHADGWIARPEGYPKELHERSYELGIQGIIYPEKYGGTPPREYPMDAFYELIMVDEFARLGGGYILGQGAINSMALPPLLLAGTEEMKETVCRSVIRGEKSICLAISEPGAGSDVANIQCSAVRQGDVFLVNGIKKWITGGAMADYFTVAVRTGHQGMNGISLLLIDRDSVGVSVRKMKTQFDSAHSTTMVVFEDVRVPVSRLVGEENKGFKLIMRNFNHERFIISVSACRAARLCYQESIEFAMVRETFGKKLIEHQIIRYKLAEMARQIESLHDNLERIAYQFSKGIPDSKLGGQCALAKVQASKTFEYCAREASQIFGGSSVVREGKGKIVERLYRDVRAQAIPGGSEEILLDFAIRQAAQTNKRAKL